MNNEFSNIIKEVLEDIPVGVKTFVTTVTGSFALVLVTHFFTLSLVSFVWNDWSILARSFSFSQWTVSGRALLLLPYVVVPLVSGYWASTRAKLAGLLGFKSKRD